MRLECTVLRVLEIKIMSSLLSLVYSFSARRLLRCSFPWHYLLLAQLPLRCSITSLHTQSKKLITFLSNGRELVMHLATISLTCRLG